LQLRWSLYQNKAQWQELKDFYVAREQFRNFMDALHEGDVPEAKFLPVDRSNSAPSIAEPSDQGNRSQLDTLNGGSRLGKQQPDPVEVLFDLNGSKNGNGKN
jgi:hypothetical protein